MSWFLSQFLVHNGRLPLARVQWARGLGGEGTLHATINRSKPTLVRRRLGGEGMPQS